MNEQAPILKIHPKSIQPARRKIIMRNYYEILFALVVSSNEEEIKALLERLEKTMNSEGAVVEEIQRLDRKEFAYPHRHMNAALYVNFMITADPLSIAKIRNKFTLSEEVTLQNYFQKGKVGVSSTASTKIKGKAPQPAIKTRTAHVAV